ncbi:MAG: lytic transglycosylase domain-containing protein [Helicobacter sp.]|nr:lytic transglycosylase domain-containing protein [Helicobacter sp.]
MLFRILAFFIFLNVAHAAKITLDSIQNYPKGIARDFYIFHFINQKDSSNELALKAYNLALYKTPRLQNALSKKLPLELLPKEIYCKKLDFKTLLNQDTKCIESGLKLDDVLGKNQSDLANKLSSQHLKNIVQTLKSAKLDKNAIFDATPAEIMQIFTSINKANKLDLFEGFTINDRSKTKLIEIINAKNAGFDRAISQIVLDQNFKTLQNMLLDIDVSKLNASSNAYFYLAFNQVLNKKDVDKKLAKDLFKKAQDATNSGFYRDRALFWRYLMSQDSELLEELHKSNNPNIFSIYASYLLKKEPEFDVSTLQSSKNNANFDVSNPFAWQEIRSSLKDADKNTFDAILAKLDSAPTLPHLAYAKNIEEKYAKNYFLFAYDESKIWDNALDKALNYAIARQESQLIPAVVSPSYALGMMQIMFFNVPHFANEIYKKNDKKPAINEFDMFNPKTALAFGKYYIDELKEQFKSPLFSAYAYNAGPTFLRRLLKKGNLFVQNRDFEPWISMEQIPYEETRFYGMRVIANYVIYAKLLGVDLNLNNLLKEVLINKGAK